MTVVTDTSKRQTPSLLPPNRWTGDQTQTGPVVPAERITVPAKNHMITNADPTLLPLRTVSSMIVTVLLLLLPRPGSILDLTIVRIALD